MAEAIGTGQFKHAVCRGAFALGTACGHCERCAIDPLNPANLRASPGAPTHQVISLPPSHTPLPCDGWKGPLWGAIHAYFSAPNSAHREQAAIDVECAVEHAMACVHCRATPLIGDVAVLLRAARLICDGCRAGYTLRPYGHDLGGDFVHYDPDGQFAGVCRAQNVQAALRKVTP